MARPKNEQQYEIAKERILQIGLDLMIKNSYHSVGINQVLKAAEIPRGSFYHYFMSKEDFALQTLNFYHQRQLEYARSFLDSDALPPYRRLKRYFKSIISYFGKLEFSQGCLMCNMSMEVGDTNDAFRQQLKTDWNELSAIIAGCLAQMDNSEIGLAQLSDAQAAELLLNSWSGALTRMKVEKSAKPLKLFCETFFSH